MNRRTFTALTAGAGLHVLTSRKAAAFQASQERLTIHPDVEIGTIRPELHSHFAEHLGSCTYGGLWVGKNSSIPNINGHRKLAVEYLKALGVPVLRWPGGCFADDYHWRDGIGPAEKRPKRVNLWWGMYTEDNSFGTHEFVELCRLIGAEPYFAGNVGSGTPAELRQWVEYCNYPEGSTLSDERIKNGARDPFKIKYWGVGNENWGCGGRMTAEEYAANYRRYATYISARTGIGGTPLFLIACGPNRNDPVWSRNFLEGMGRGLNMVHGFAMHFYSNGKAEATKFTVDNLREQLSTFADMDKAIVQQHGILRGYDPSGRIGMLVDEWGVWDRMNPEEDKKYGRLWQQITMRSAVAAAMGLNVFHRNADKLVMCNIAQIVNVLHSLLLTEGDKCIRTSTYYAYELLKPHRGATAVVSETGSAKDPLGLSVSASRKGGQLVVTMVNPLPDKPMDVDCTLAGASARSVSATILHDSDFNACNTFSQPDRIVPKSHTVSASGGKLQTTLPPMSVVTATVQV